MINPKNYIEQLAEYIIKNLSKGYTIDSLKTALIQQGYSRAAIERAVKRANDYLARTAPIMKEKPQIFYEITSE